MDQVSLSRRAWLGGLASLATAAQPPTSNAPGGDPARLARLRTAICAYSFRNELQRKTLRYEDLVDLAVRHDVDGLDLTVYWFPSTSADFLLPLKRHAYRMGVDIYSISVRTEMTRPTAAERDQEVDGVMKWVDVAATLGARHIRVFGGDVPQGASEDEAASWVVDVLARSAPYAARKGVILGLENHGGITATAARILEIVKTVNSPWVAVNLDTGNFTQRPYEQIEMLIPYAANVQVKVEIEVEPGKKVPSDWKRILGMLAAGGYKGYVALEYEAKADPLTEVPRLVRQLRQLVSELHSRA